MVSRKERKPVIMVKSMAEENSFREGRITRSMTRLKKRLLKLEAKAEAKARTKMIDCLPTEMMVEIVARVAAVSTVDLFRCKLSCKALQEIGDEKQVLQQAAIEDLYSRLWYHTDEAESFFKKCVDCNNPEALYRLGMVQYFAQFMVEEGLENLKKAAKQGYKDAIYVLGLILLCTGDKESKTKGYKLLMNLMKVIRGEDIIKSRKKLFNLMSTLQWLQDLKTRNTQDGSLAMEAPKISCPMGALHELKSNWDKEDYFHDMVEDNVVCEACKCGREAGFFCSVVTVVVDVHD